MIIWIVKTIRIAGIIFTKQICLSYKILQRNVVTISCWSNYPDFMWLNILKELSDIKFNRGPVAQFWERSVRIRKVEGSSLFGPDSYYALMRAHIMCYDSNTSTWRVLYNGLCGDDVAQLQIRLYRLGYLNGECDGIFGTATENALIDYQEDKGLVADGIAGAATFAKMTGTYSRYEREYRPCNECPNS